MATKPIVTSVSIAGYKSFKTTSKINISPLTILAGSNSSGKSSFFQPFLLLKQTQEVSYNPEGILLHGPNLKIHDTQSIFTNENRAKELEIGFYFNDSTEIVNVYKKDEVLGVVLAHSKIVINNEIHHVSNNSSRKELEQIFLLGENDRDKFYEVFGKRKFYPKLDLNRGFFDILFSQIGKTGMSIKGGLYDRYITNCRRFVNFLHVPGIRGNPERNYQFSSMKGKYTGKIEDYVASIIFKWKNSTSKKEKEKLSRLQDMLSTVGLTSSISAEKVNDAFVSIKVGSLPNVKSNLVLNIADVGFGVSQTLPILVALIEAKRGQSVYIEQPELHLHPNAQVELAKVIAKSLNDGINIILETHSSLMLRVFQTMIANKTIKNSDVSFNWFCLDKRGFSKISAAKIDKKGRYGNWPQNFDDVSLETESSYIKATFDAQ